MQIACCQFDITWENKPANYERVAQMVAAADLPAGTLLLLPEMFATGYSMNADLIAEALDGPTARFLSELAAQHRIFVLGGLAVRQVGAAARNEALVFGPDGHRLARYAKMHPFGLAGEANFYAAGNEVVCFDWAGCRVALTICYDLRFPELYRQAASDGAEIMTVIANWPLPRHEHWLTLLRARAIENQACVVGVNRCGKDPWLTYPGRSQIIDPQGVILADAGDRETILRTEIDPAMLRQWRAEFPALRDRRADL